MGKKKNIYEIIKNLENDKCMEKNCKRKVIKSHIISKWILKIICDEKNHVIAETQKINSEKLLEKRGWTQEGVTFKLFCSEHDNKIFKPIENNAEEIKLWTVQQIKILNYRIICTMLYNYKLGFKKVSDPDYNDAVDKKYRWPESSKLKLKSIIKNNLEREKKKLLCNNEKINVKIYEFEHQNNVLFSSVLQTKSYNFDCYFHLLSNKTKSYFIISSYNNTENSCFKYIKTSLEKLNINEQKIFITNLLLGHGTNGIFYNVEWFNKNQKIKNLYIYSDNYFNNLANFGIEREKNKGFNFWS